MSCLYRSRKTHRKQPKSESHNFPCDVLDSIIWPHHFLAIDLVFTQNYWEFYFIFFLSLFFTVFNCMYFYYSSRNGVVKCFQVTSRKIKVLKLEIFTFLVKMKFSTLICPSTHFSSKVGKKFHGSVHGFRMQVIGRAKRKPPGITIRNWQQTKWRAQTCANEKN